MLLGLAQALALIPGVSRSGATISMGLFLGLKREAATRLAFLLAIPAVVGAGLFELKDIPNGDNDYGWGPTIVATVVSLRRRVRRDRLAAAVRLRRTPTRRSSSTASCLGVLTLVLLWTGVIVA